MELPKEIKHKIKKIVSLEHEKRYLMREISEWRPDKLDMVPVEALRDGWDWEMYFRGSPREINEKEIEAVILTALTGEIHRPNYAPVKSISLNELMKQNETKKNL